MKKCSFCSEMIQDEAVKCRYCGSSLAAVASSAARTREPASMLPSVRPRSRSSKWVKPVAALFLLVGAYLAAQSSPSITALVVVGSLAAIAATLFGRMAATPPRWIQAFSGWILRRPAAAATVVSMLVLGAYFGRDQRLLTEHSCADGMISARRSQSVGDLKTAAEHCSEIGRSDLLSEARSTIAELEADAEARTAKDNAAEYQRLLTAGRRQATETGASSTSIASLRAARNLGPLEERERKLLAAQLVLHSEELTKSDPASAPALTQLLEAKALHPSLTGIDDAIAQAQAAKVDAELVGKINAAKTAIANKCDDISGLALAFQALRSTPKAHRHYQDAAAVTGKMEKCRRKTYQEMFGLMRKLEAQQRAEWATAYERRLLGGGLNVRVRLGGASRDQLTIQYVLFDRAWAYQITDSGSMAAGSVLWNLQEIGVKRVTFSDGYDSSFSYDLKPLTAKQVLDQKGYDKPFHMDAA